MTRNETSVYDSLLALQADMSFGLERGLFECSEWGGAKTVLDLGCGNGAYLGLLAGESPDKAFTGLDPNEDLIALAQSRNTRTNVTFHLGTYETLAPDARFDFVVSRLALMYVHDLAGLLEQVGPRTNRGVLCIDADDDAFLMSSGFPEFTNALVKIRARADRLGGKRTILQDLPQLWDAVGFDLAWKRTIVVPSSLPLHKARMHHLMMLNAELVCGSPLPSSLSEEIFTWSLTPGTFLQYGLTAALYVPR